ncbi:MAG: amino acid permease [Selenomonadaceae bacterium]|nr:amino acid permease [Selenomonadaceae bacterium]
MSEKKSLTKFLTPLQVCALSFCCCVGWGSFIMPGKMFLSFAGPLGSTIAVVAGAAVMIIIAANYHLLINRHPDSGGVFTYTKKILGYDHALLCAWALWLTYISIIWANATAFVLVGRNFFGDVLQFGFHYVLFGYDVYFGEVLLTLSVMFLFGALDIRRKIFAMKLTTALSIFFLACGLIFAAGALATDFRQVFNPAFSMKYPTALGIFSIVALAPWAFVGFEAVSNFTEEFNFSPKKSFTLMALGIIAGAAFYISMTLLAAAAHSENFPNRYSFTTHLDAMQGFHAVPTFHAVHAIFGEAGLFFMGLTVMAAIATSLLGLYSATSRLIYATTEDNILSRWFSKLNAQGVPSNAILFLLIISISVPFVGRTMISWVVDATTIGATIVYGYVSACAYIIAKREGLPCFKVTGAAGVFFSAVFAMFLLFPNFWSSNILATESYFVLVAWSVFGFVFFQKVFERDEMQRFGKSVIVWIVMLFFIFFGSLMWIRQETDESIEVAVDNMGEFYQSELESYGVKFGIMQKVKEEYYLKSQMNNIRSRLFQNSTVQMAFILLSLFIMFNIYSAILQRERDAKLAKIQAEESSRAKTNFLSNMSHDIRTPMNAIIGYTNLAQRKDISPEEVQDFLGKIQNSSQHLLALINDVLEMSRIESGKMELDNSPADITKVLRDLNDMFATQMEGKQINFSVDSKVTHRAVSCDTHRLNRVLLNLTSNAYKFTPEGGTISITLTEISATESHATYELRVKDSGIGMASDFAKTVFEPFTRERTSTVSGIQGTGLGMAITKSIVDLMGGTIDVVTAPGRGTEFILRVSFELVDAAEIEPEVPAVEQVAELDFSRKKLLLVEDIEVNREIALMILEEVGFNVDTAVNGKDAVEKVAASKPGEYDAVLMDIQMPVMNGYEAAAAIRALENKKLAAIPIIAMTANAFSEDVERAKAAGMNDHIAKPLDVPKMMETLQKVLS